MKSNLLLLPLLFLCVSSALVAGQQYHTQETNQSNPTHAPSQGRVIIDAVASDSVKLAMQDLIALGLESPSTIGKLISGVLPADALEVAEKLQSINQIRANRTITAAGNLTSEGDTALRSASARNSFGVDGSGISVAVISDSYNCLGGEENDRTSNDLPAQTTVVEEAMVCDGLVDEGRAIMHLVHDIAPGAELFFLSGTNGYARTANGILKLANQHNVDIIVDDAKSLAAPFFQKGVLAQAVEKAVQQGVIYVTAAGNSARLSYQSTYRNSYNPVLDLNAHDFDSGTGTDIYQRIEIPEGKSISLMFQWDSPAYSVSGRIGATTDLDIHLVNSKNESIVAQSTDTNIGRDPVEILEFYNPEGSGQTDYDLLISKAAGTDPSIIKYILFNRFDGKIKEHHSNSGTIFGHANVASAITVGAGNFQETPAFGYSSPLLEYFSSAGGGTPWLFNASGARLAEPQTPEKPDLIAPDNVNTQFNLGEDTDGDGNPNFRGTSAAAPHIAGVAALMLQSNSELKPRDIKAIMELTALDVTHRNDTNRTFVGEEYDQDSGYGLVDAHKAVSVAKSYEPSSVRHNSSTDSVTVYDVPSGGGSIDLFVLLLALAIMLISVTTTYNNSHQSIE